MSDLYSSDSVDGLTHLDWTPGTRDTEWVLKWVLVCIAEKCPHIHRSDHRELRNMWWVVLVVVGGGGGWWV